MRKISRALISVTDKSGLVELALGLTDLGVEILSTGGTARLLREAGIAVKDVSEVTQFPEMLDGRVKTLHPAVHGALLARRNNPEHMKTLESHSIGLIDMVVVNLYQFEQTAAAPRRQLRRRDREYRYRRPLDDPLGGEKLSRCRRSHLARGLPEYSG